MKGLNEFVASNIDSLAKDIAAGRGGVTDTMAELMGISADRRKPCMPSYRLTSPAFLSSERIGNPTLLITSYLLSTAKF